MEPHTRAHGHKFSYGCIAGPLRTEQICLLKVLKFYQSKNTETPDSKLSPCVVKKIHEKQTVLDDHLLNWYSSNQESGEIMKY